MADENENNLPATQEDALPALKMDHLPDQIYGAENITDNLPASIYATVGGLADTLSDEQLAKFKQAVPDDEVDIRPDDGMVYVSHEYVRRRMDDVFGPLAWTMLQATPLKDRVRDGRREFFAVFVMTIRGVYVAKAMASRVLVDNNPKISLDDTAEMIESQCVVRCAKKIGLALEPWNRRWRDEWKKKYAIKVVATNWKGQRVEMWRRKDADPLEGEVSAERRQPPPQQHSSSAQPESRSPGRGSQADAGTKVAQGGNPPSAASAPPKAAETEVKPPTPSAPPQTGKQPAISQGQVNLVLARARAAELIVNDDPTLLMDILERGGIPLADGTGRTQMENAIAMVKSIPMRGLNAVLKAIDAAKSQEEAERI